MYYILDGATKVSTITGDPAEAKRALDQYVMGKAAATPPVPPSPLVSDLLDAYRAVKLEESRERTDTRTYDEVRRRLVAEGVPAAEAHARATSAAATAASAVDGLGSTETVIRHLRRHLGTQRVADIRQGMVDRYERLRRDEGVSKYSTKEVIRRVGNGTIVRELTILRAAINWAGKGERKEAWFGDRPKPEFSMPADGNGRPRQRFLSKGEAARLIAACHLPHVRLFIRVALSTGARKEAIEDLRWDQVDFGANFIDFGWVEHRKRRPLIQMTKELKEELLKAKAVSTTPWVIELNGRRAGNIKKSLSKAIAAAGLRSLVESEDVTGHVLKHTFVSWLLNAGKSFHQIARLLNTSPQTLERHYGHWDVSRADEIGDAVRLDAELARFARWSVPELADEVGQEAAE